MAHLFSEFAETAVSKLALYRRLCEGAATDLEVAARLLLAPPDQQVPNLLLAAVHDVLLAGEQSPLAQWYPTVLGEASVARKVGDGDDDPWPHFRTLALHHPQVEMHLKTARTQTNEVGRCSALYPAIWSVLANRGPVGLIELGASAGLNTDPTRYGYRYLGDQPITSIGPKAKLILECQLRGIRVPQMPPEPFEVASAVGVDLNPLNVGRLSDSRWLLACQWPEETDRCAQLQAALALATVVPPQVRRGDLAHELSSLIAAVPDGAYPIVTATWVLGYLSLNRQRELLGELERIGRHRDLAFVFAEQPERIPGLPMPPRSDGVVDGRSTALVAMEWVDGRRNETRLGDMHPHGRWIEWLEGPNVWVPVDSEPNPLFS